MFPLKRYSEYKIDLSNFTQGPSINTSDYPYHTGYEGGGNSYGDSKSIFDTCKLPVAKVFRGPHWGICDEAVKALECEGFTHLYNHTDYKHLTSDVLKMVYYNWNLKDEPSGDDTLVTHGHTHNVCSNGISETLDKVSRFIDHTNPVFKFVDEL